AASTPRRARSLPTTQTRDASGNASKGTIGIDAKIHAPARRLSTCSASYSRRKLRRRGDHAIRQMLEHFPATLALIGIVVLVSSLLSGWVDRTGLPQVAIFLLLGLVLGPLGLGLLDLNLRSTALQVIATLALVLVLFSDAIGLDIGDVRRNRRLGLFVLGPGTLLPALLISAAAWLLLRLSVPAALILGAALASTDPV